MLVTGWQRKSEGEENEIVSVLPGYKLHSAQHMKFNMIGIIATTGGNCAHIFDSTNLDQPIVSYPLIFPGGEPAEDCFGIGVIGKYLLLHDRRTRTVSVFSQNLLMGPIRKVRDRAAAVYSDWTYKEYSDIDSLFQTISLETFGDSTIFERTVYLETEDIEKAFALPEPRAVYCTAMRFLTRDGIVELGMTPLTPATVKSALVSVQSPYKLRQLEIFLQSIGYPLNEYMAQLSEGLMQEGYTRLAFRYAVLSEKEPIQVLSDYLKYEALYDAIYRWVLQILVYEKSLSSAYESHLQQYVLVLAYIIVKTRRKDLAPYIRFSEFKQIFRKEKYVDYGSFSSRQSAAQRSLFAEDAIGRHPWLLSLARILFSSALARLIHEKEGYILSDLNKLMFGDEQFLLALPKQEKRKEEKKMTLDLISLQKEIMSTQARESRSVKYYTKTVSWVRERLQQGTNQLEPARRAEMYILRGMVASAEPNIFYQLKHRNKCSCSSVEDFQSYTDVLRKMSPEEIVETVVAVTFDYRIFSPDKPLVKSAKVDSFLAFNNGLLTPMRADKGNEPTKMFEQTALTYLHSEGGTRPKLMEKVKKIRSHLAISYNSLKQKYAHYFAAFLTPYVAALIVLAQKEVYPLTPFDYQLMKLLSLLITKLNSSLEMRSTLRLLVECGRWQLAGKLMAELSEPVLALQALYIANRDQSADEVSRIAISFLGSAKQFEYYQFLFRFLGEHREVLPRFEEQLLDVSSINNTRIGSKTAHNRTECADQPAGAQFAQQRHLG